METKRAAYGSHQGGQKAQRVAAGWYTVVRRLLALHRQLKKQERYCAEELPVLIKKVTGNASAMLSSKEIGRISKYYQLALNVICENLYNLTGQKLSEDEHRRILLMSTFMPLFDDLYDEHILDHQQINALVTAPERYTPVHTTDWLAKALYLELLRTSPQPQRLLEHLLAGSFWEKESQQQQDEAISEDRLYHITYNKSYFGIILFCVVLDHYPSGELLSILYPASGLMQLTNDAFDVWKDVHKGVYTLPNLYRNYAQLQEQFLAEIANINDQLSQLPYAVPAKQDYAITLHALNAMGWMSLEQLKRETAGIAGIEELKGLSRKQLVCDMDSLLQYIKWVKYVRRFVNYETTGRLPLVKEPELSEGHSGTLKPTRRDCLRANRLY